MRHRGRLNEVLRRAEHGPIVEESQFDSGLIAPAVKRKAAEFGLHYDGKTIVPHDDDMADRLYEAALDYVTEVGMYCQDTSRRILWTRAEYEEGLRHCPSEAVLGAGHDAVSIRARRPEDPAIPATGGSPVCVPASEDLFVPMMLSYAQEPVIEFLPPACTLLSAYGTPIKAGSPWEIMAGWRESELCLQVLNIAGRPGMSLDCVSIASTALGGLSPASYGGFRPTDRHLCSVVAELKTNYDELSKVAHITRIDANMEAFLSVIYGGYYGGYEGLAIGIAAGLIALNQNYMPTTLCGSANHPLYRCGSAPGLIWAKSLALQALSRNTKLLITSMISTAGGPGTRSILYENAAMATANVVSGVCVVESCLAANGVNPGHASGLEAKLACEVGKASAGMTRGEANALCEKLVPRYLDGLQQRPIGRPFNEVYDLETLQPIPEWQGMYEEVKGELRDMGWPLR